jgi:hypothetical protein
VRNIYKILIIGTANVTALLPIIVLSDNQAPNIFIAHLIHYKITSLMKIIINLVSAFIRQSLKPMATLLIVLDKFALIMRQFLVIELVDGFQRFAINDKWGVTTLVTSDSSQVVYSQVN